MIRAFALALLLTRLSVAAPLPFQGNWFGELRDETLANERVSFDRCTASLRSERSESALLLRMEATCATVAYVETHRYSILGETLIDEKGITVGTLKKDELLVRLDRKNEVEIFRISLGEFNAHVTRAKLSKVGRESHTLRGTLMSSLVDETRDQPIGPLAGKWRGWVDHEIVGTDKLFFGVDCRSEVTVAPTTNLVKISYSTMCQKQIMSMASYEYALKDGVLYDAKGKSAGVFTEEALEHRSPIGGFTIGRLLRDGDRLLAYVATLDSDGRVVSQQTTTGTLRRVP